MSKPYLRKRTVTIRKTSAIGPTMYILPDDAEMQRILKSAEPTEEMMAEHSSERIAHIINMSADKIELLVYNMLFGHPELPTLPKRGKL